MNKLRLIRGYHGKPLLHHSTTLETPFGYSRSNDQTCALCAIADSNGVGTDVETIPLQPAELGILINRHLTHAESQWVFLHGSPCPARFMQIWTVKEACLKASGVGLSAGLKSVHLSFDANGEIKAEVPGRQLVLLRWRTHTIALCAQRHELTEVRYHLFDQMNQPVMEQPAVLMQSHDVIVASA